MKDNNIEIKCSESDLHKLGIVDRWIRTFGEKLNMYLDIHHSLKSLKFIDEFNKLLMNIMISANY